MTTTTHKPTMTQLRECTMFATAEPCDRPEFDGTWFKNIASEHGLVGLYYSRHPTVRVHMREAGPDETTPYWAWWENKDAAFRYLWPARFLVEMCFGDHTVVKLHEERGRGKLLRVVVTTQGSERCWRVTPGQSSPSSSSSGGGPGNPT